MNGVEARSFEWGIRMANCHQRRAKEVQCDSKSDDTSGASVSGVRIAGKEGRT
jgi:hypothetical protein